MKNHLLHKYNSFLGIFFLTIFLIGCSKVIPNPDSPFFSIQNLGLENTHVNQMVLKDNQLYAMTSEGIYVKDINSSNSFRLLGLGGKNIEDAVIFSENDILVSFKNAVFFTDFYPTPFSHVAWPPVQLVAVGGAKAEHFSKS